MSTFVFMKNLVLLIVLMISFNTYNTYAQSVKNLKKPVQLSGVVVTGDSLNPVKDAFIKIVKTDSIDYSYFFNVLTDEKGYFLLMAKPGDVLEFKKVGYVNSRFVVPDTLTRAASSFVQILYSIASLKDTSQLRETTPKK